jgi:hypothetical protein
LFEPGTPEGRRAFLFAPFSWKAAPYCARRWARRGNRLAAVALTLPRSFGHWSAISEAASEFRVAKGRTEATLTLSNSASVHGWFFVAGSSATHEGPERVKDVLNAEGGFFPFEVDGSSGTRTVLYNRDHVIFVSLRDNNEPRLDPGYGVATRRIVSMLLSNGARLEGVVSVHRPQGHNRLSDFARSPEHFCYLEMPNGTSLVNVRHLIELVEEMPNP